MTDQLYTEEELAQAAAIANPQQQAPEPNLPPPGAARRDELARRTDDLQQAAEELTPESGKIDPKVFEPDRDLQRAIRRNYLDLDIGPQYVVKWVNFHSQHSKAVWEAKADGWQVVTASMLKPEDQALAVEDNTVRVGDVIAMFIRKDIHLMLEQEAEERRLRQQYVVESELSEIASKHPKALKVHSDLTGSNPYAEQMQKRAAQKTALNHLGNQMKKGPLPGVPIK